jgi:large subunit ribosomal protein L22e
MILKDFEKYLHDRIKVNGKAGNLGTKVNLSVEKSKMIVNAEMPFSKRYLKYLSKKYIKKIHLSNFVRVVATSKGAYEIKIFNV